MLQARTGPRCGTCCSTAELHLMRSGTASLVATSPFVDCAQQHVVSFAISIPNVAPHPTRGPDRFAVVFASCEPAAASDQHSYHYCCRSAAPLCGPRRSRPNNLPVLPRALCMACGRETLPTRCQWSSKYNHEWPWALRTQPTRCGTRAARRSVSAHCALQTWPFRACVHAQARGRDRPSPAARAALMTLCWCAEGR